MRLFPVTQIVSGLIRDGILSWHGYGGAEVRIDQHVPFFVTRWSGLRIGLRRLGGLGRLGRLSRDITRQSDHKGGDRGEKKAATGHAYPQNSAMTEQ
jgi:hypothetical protein